MCHSACSLYGSHSAFVSFKMSNSHFGTGSDVRIKIRTPSLSIKKQLYMGSKQGDTATTYQRVEKALAMATGKEDNGCKYLFV